MRQEVKGFDEIVSANDDDFEASGLVGASLIRLGFLTAIPQSKGRRFDRLNLPRPTSAIAGKIEHLFGWIARESFTLQFIISVFIIVVYF